MSVYEFLRELLIDEFGVDAERIGPASTPEQLGLDSFAMIEIIGELEREYAIEFSEKRMNFATLQDAVVQATRLIEAAS